MSAKFRNKIKRVLYRPARKRPNVEYVAGKLGDAENALAATVGGIFGGKKGAQHKPKAKAKAKTEDEEE